MHLFTALFLLFVYVACAVSDDPGHHDHHDYHDHHSCRHDDHHDYERTPLGGLTEGDVIRELKARHVKRGVPPSNGSPDIGVGLYLESVLDLNAEAGYMEISGYLTLKWTDPRLRFHYSQWVKDVRMSRDDIWLPDIEVYNQVSRGMRIVSANRCPVMVKYDGSVIWMPLVSIRFLCPVDDNNSDEIKCEMKLGSWSYHGNQMDVHVDDSGDPLAYYERSGRWEVANVTSKRFSVNFSCCVDNYIYISTVFTLKKNDI